MKYDIKKIFPQTDDYTKLEYDIEGMYSITHFIDADIISKIILSNYENSNNLKIVDCTAGIGGNTISFYKFFYKLTSIELSKEKYKMLKNNTSIYGINSTKILNMSCIDYIKQNNEDDVFFFDPPWGGLDYKNKKNLRLKLDNLSLDQVIELIENRVNKLIIFKLPFNYDFNEFSEYNYKLYKIQNYYLVFI
jgi:16S rRNA G966 N2-methylase RsmD